MDTSSTPLTRGSLVRVVDAYPPWAGHVGVVIEQRGDLVVTGPIFSPRGIRYGDRFTFWHEDLEHGVDGWTREQLEAVNATPDETIMPAPATGARRLSRALHGLVASLDPYSRRA